MILAIDRLDLRKTFLVLAHVVLFVFLKFRSVGLDKPVMGFKTFRNRFHDLGCLF